MPWYKSGTVSVTLNSSAVIGSGTAFIANSRVGDAFRGPDGDWYEVTNIASDTAMSISPNYKGATTAGGVYAIMPVQGYQKGLADQVRDWVNTYGSKMAALGTAAAATLSTGQTDTTVGRAARIGDFGLGSTGASTVVVWPNGSLNNVLGIGQGSYSTAGPLTDVPAGFTPSTVRYAVRTGDGTTTGEYMQTLTSLTGSTATRGGTGNPSLPTWGAWVISAKSGANSDITSLSGITAPISITQGGTGKTSMGAAAVGPVSQSGGVPTGAVIETNANANGTYTKYADGTLICTRAGDTALTTNGTFGALWQSGLANFTFPMPFAGDLPRVIPTVAQTTTAGAWGGTSGTHTLTGVTVFVTSVVSNVTAKPGYIAIGRWF
jgi:hypothetical protein